MQVPTTGRPVSTMEATKILLVVLLVFVSADAWSPYRTKGNQQHHATHSHSVVHHIHVSYHHHAPTPPHAHEEANDHSEEKVNELLEELESCPNPKSQYCDGPWTVIQKRSEGGVSFNRSWEEYKWGFPEDHGSDFWLGLEYLHRLTGRKPYSLQVKMTDQNGIKAEVNYDSIKVESEEDNYLLHLGRCLPYPLHNCSSIESMMERHGMVHGGSSRCNAMDGLRDSDGVPFSTYDRDNDLYEEGSCAQMYGSGFWFSACFYANPNGKYGDNEEAMGIVWDTFRPMDRSLAAFEMAIKPAH